MRVAVVGGAGYIGGELARILLGHPKVELTQVTSDSLAGRPLFAAHPNLRGATTTTFDRHSDLRACDVVFLATPPGVAARLVPELSGRAGLIVDLSPDFRHCALPAADPLPDSPFTMVAGIPELYRDQINGASHISVPGCMANAAMLALHPLARAGLIHQRVLIDARTGSSGSGAVPSRAGHHPERSGALRIYASSGHRHRHEIDRHCGVSSAMSVTAVEAVRGIQVVVHATTVTDVDDHELWSHYLRRYGDEPFIRLLSKRYGMHRWPEPKVLAGSNFCDIGFEVDADQRSVFVVAALDNLMKGGAGNAVHCMNIAAGLDETSGLEFLGLHPV